MSTTIYLVMGSAGEYDDHHEWVEKAFSEQTAAELHALELTDKQTRLNGLIDQANEFGAKWQKSNPRPEYKTHTLKKEPKWTGLRNNQITPQMRAERDRIRAENAQALEEDRLTQNEWYNRKREATIAFLMKYWPDMKEQIDNIGKAVYPAHRDVQYTVDTTELD